MNPSAVVRTGVYLVMTALLMLFIVPGDSFTAEKEKIPSASIQKEGERSDTDQTAPLPAMFLKNNEYDVGEVYEGAPVIHAFTISNRGKGDLVIQSVKPG